MSNNDKEIIEYNKKNKGKNFLVLQDKSIILN